MLGTLFSGLLLLSLGCRLMRTASPAPAVPSASPAPDTAEPEAVTLEMDAEETTRPTPVPTPPATPIPTPLQTDAPSFTPEPTRLGILSGLHADRFSSDAVVHTADTYRDDARSITLTRTEDSTRTGNTLVYFVADIWVKDVESIRRVQANPVFRLGATASIEKMSEAANAIVAMSGDYCQPAYKSLVVINGETVHNSKRFDRDLCVLYRDGTMEMYAPRDIVPDDILARDPWITWNFGPILLDDRGQPLQTFNLPDTIGGKNPRAAIGYFEPGHYCFVVADGRQKGYSLGLDLDELAELMHDLGCTAAYNLDGGISAQISWDGKRVNSPESIRSIRDIVCVVNPSEQFDQPVNEP